MLFRRLIDEFSTIFKSIVQMLIDEFFTSFVCVQWLINEFPTFKNFTQMLINYFPTSCGLRGGGGTQSSISRLHKL